MAATHVAPDSAWSTNTPSRTVAQSGLRERSSDAIGEQLGEAVYEQIKGM
jgi:hypothetical protein